MPAPTPDLLDDPARWPHVPPPRPPELGVAAGIAVAPPMHGYSYEPAARWRTWGCGDIVYGLVIGVVLQFVFLVPLVMVGVSEESLAAQAFGVFALWIGLAGWPLFCSWVRGLGSLKLDFGWAFRWYDVFLGLALTFSMFLLSFGLSRLQDLIHVEAASNTDFLQEQADQGAGWAYLGLTLLVAVGAPLAEELFFRGLTYSALRNRAGRAVAVIGSGLLFGLVHFQPGPLVPTLFLLLHLAVFGLLLGLSRMWFDRTGPGVFAHMFFNLTAVLVILAGV